MELILYKKIKNLSKDCENFSVSYDKLKFTSELDTNEGIEFFINNIYYDNNLLKYISNNNVVYSNLNNTYLLNGLNGEEDFLFVFNELPVPQISENYIILFNKNGDVKFLDTATSTGNIINFNESNKELSYTKISEEFRDVMDIRCDIIENYDNNTVYSTEYTYKYENSQMNLIKSNQVTINDLKIQYACN